MRNMTVLSDQEVTILEFYDDERCPKADHDFSWTKG